MSMQDNDIDALFSNKLKHLEVEPAAQVWKGIALELDGAKHKSRLVPLIRIAASVLLVVSAGLLFLMKEAKTSFTAANTHNKPSLVKESTDEEGNINIATQILGKHHIEEQPIAQANDDETVNHPAKIAMLEDDEYPQESVETKSHRIVDTEPELVAASAEQPVTSDVSFAAYHNVSATDKFIAAANTEDAPAAKPSARKRGIRTLGDLINTVVAKVDNRENKLIEFSNTDDGGSIVSGVNLGVIRIKKD